MATGFTARVWVIVWFGRVVEYPNVAHFQVTPCAVWVSNGILEVIFFLSDLAEYPRF